MKTFKLSNAADSEMLVVFEPVGDTFNLPPGENLQLLVFDEQVGLDVDSLNIQVDVVNEKSEGYHMGRKKQI